MIVQDVNDASKQRKIITQACIIAMGAKGRELGVAGEKEYEAKGVYGCAFCDGPLYKGKEVAVVGGGDSAVLDAEYLSGIAKKVYVLVRSDEMKGTEKIRRDQMLLRENVEVLYKTQIEEIKGSKEGVTSIVVSQEGKGKAELPVEAVFLAIGSIPNTAPFVGQLDLDGQGYIVVKNHAETSVPGVFAVGDIADPRFKQAISAGGEGAKAAIQAQMYLSKQNIVAAANRRVAPKPVKEGTKVIEVQSAQELQNILQTSQVPVFVDFYASWCPPCQKLIPMLDVWAKELQGKVIICKVNIDKGKELTQAYNIRSMPTLLQMDPQGRELMRKVGIEEISQQMNSLKAF
jgi:thioredoxin reductase (NADPH)